MLLANGFSPTKHPLARNALTLDNPPLFLLDTEALHGLVVLPDLPGGACWFDAHSVVLWMPPNFAKAAI